MILAQRTITLPVLRWAMISLASFAILSSLLAIGQAFGWHPVPQWNDKPPGFFFNSVAQGEILALVVLICFVERIYWLAIPMLPGLWLSQSRGGIVALVFGLIAIWVRRPLILLILALAATIYWTHNPNSSDYQRLLIWHAAWTHLTFWGNGFGSFWDLWIGNPAWWPQYVHNDYLQTVFELGVWSIIPFAGLLWLVSHTQSRYWPVLVAGMFMATFSMPLHIPFALAILILASISIFMEQVNV
jgi:hypothetical protein